MSVGRDPIVLDSWAIMAYLGDEPGGERVAEIMAEAVEKSTPLIMSVVNAAEVWYTVARRVSEAEADATETALRELGIEFVDADWKLSHCAARFKWKHRMPLADCFAAALASLMNGRLVTGDADFRQVDGHISVQWL